MKKIKLALCVSVAILLLISCKTTKPVAQQTQQQYQLEPGRKNLVPWNQAYFSYFTGSNRPKLDTVSFYAGAEIIIDTSLFKSLIVSVKKDGSIKIIHLIDDIFKNVLTTTPGGLAELKKGQNGEDVMSIKFSRNDGTSYTLQFWPKDDGNFTLDYNGTLRFESVDYPITLKSNSECLLYVDLEETTTRNTHRNTAEGFRK